MPPIWSFHLPTRIEFGRGAFRRLGEVAAQIGRRALLVGYRQPGPLAVVYDRAMQALRHSGVQAELLLAAEPEPTLAQALTAAAQVAAFGPDVVVGLGGGSALDLAKGVAAYLLADLNLLTALEAPGEPPEITEALPVVAVPTTARTGAEVTCVAVLTRTGEPPVKRTLVGPALLPRAALVDPELAATTPRSGLPGVPPTPWATLWKPRAVARPIR